MGDVSKSFYTSKYNFKYNNFDEALEPVSEERVKHRELLPFFIVSTEARVTWQLTPKAQLMAGTKYSYSSKTNDFRSFSLNGGQWQEDEGYGYALTYAENLQATYLKYSLDLKHWTLRRGCVANTTPPMPKATRSLTTTTTSSRASSPRGSRRRKTHSR